MLPTRLPAQVRSALDAYVQALVDRFGSRVVDVLLFGSQARGDATENSDVDVIVVLESPTAHELGEVRGFAFDVLLTYEVMLSIRAFSRENWQELATGRSLFFRNVMHDGRSLLNATA